MAQYHDYHSPNYNNQGQNRINYAELEQSRMGTTGILVVLGLIGLGVLAMFVFGDIETTTTNLGASEQGLAPATPVIPAE